MKVVLFFSAAFIFFFSNNFLISKPGKSLRPTTKDNFSNHLNVRYKLGYYGSLKAFSIYKSGQVVFRTIPVSSSPQPVESITKSVTSLVIGIAIYRKDLKDANQCILDFFPEYKNKVAKEWNAVTLKDLLTMRSGIEWEEDKRPEFLNSTYQMYKADNLYDYIFSKDINKERKFNYSSANAALLSAVIFRATGKSFAQYADKFLFKPLKIKNYKWNNYKDGSTNTSGGLYLNLEDMAKLAMLYTENGVWKGERIIDPNWISMSFKNYSVFKDYLDVNAYGYMWWINDAYKIPGRKNPVRIYSACGFNNNHIILVPELDILIVTQGDSGGQPENYLNLLNDVLRAPM